MLREALGGFATFLGYYVAMVVVLLALRSLVGLPGELFRKALHIGVAGSTLVLLHAFETWYAAALVPLAFGVLAYFVIGWAERFPRAMRALRERRSGEVRASLALVFLTMAALVALGWGWLGAGSRYAVAVAMLAWGFGDSAAAIVGKRWGHRRLRHAWVDGHKTVEGTIAMFAFAAAAAFVALVAYTPWPWYLCLVVALSVALAAAGTELVSHWGTDTVTVPVATFACLLAIVGALSTAGVVR